MLIIYVHSHMKGIRHIYNKAYHSILHKQLTILIHNTGITVQYYFL